MNDERCVRDRVTAILTLADAATGEPWEVSRYEDSDAIYFQPVWSQDEDGLWDLDSDAGRVYDEGGHSSADAAFIAASRSEVPWLARTLLEALDTIDKARAIHVRTTHPDRRFCAVDMFPWPCPTRQALGGSEDA